MNLRDWLILIGAVILIVIILDGVRRMRQAKKDSLQMSRDMGGRIDGSPLDDDYNPELPAGGARIVNKRDEDSENDPDAFSAVDASAEVAFNPESKPMVAVRDEPIHSEPDAQTVTMALTQKKPVMAAVESNLIESSAVETVVAVAPPETKDRTEKVAEKSAPARKSGRDKAVVPPTQEDTAKGASVPTEVLVINVDAKTPKGFAGSDLKRLLEACGLIHGEMSVFHRHEEDDLLSPLQFSVANGVEPGYFDADNIATISTPRVAFFMSLPGPRDSMRAFEYMLETAQCFARNLDGDLRDENRSAITQQTIEHCRQRVREFERKQLSRNRKV